MAALAGAALPAQWAHRDNFVILEAGFGQGQRFLNTWAAWRADPNRCQRLFYIAVAAQLPRQLPLSKFSETPSLADRLAQSWPVLTPGMHTLVFDEGPASQVTLLLAAGEAADLVPQMVARVDAFLLEDVPPAPLAPNGDEGWLSRLARLAAPGCTAVACGESAQVIEGLRQSGFKAGGIHAAPATDRMNFRFEPRHTPPPLPGGLRPTAIGPKQRHAMVIGAGLAGCAAAWALARQGWRITLIDAHAAPARGASGNPGGLFHSIIHGEDGTHARAHRAAAMRTVAVAAPMLAQSRFAGACQGLLRLDAQTDAAQAKSQAHRLGLPVEHVQWLDQAQARTTAHIPAPSGGWLFRQGGWLEPAGYAQALLADAQAHANVVFLAGQAVHQLQAATHGQKPWQALDTRGEIIAEAPVVVLASAVDTLTLLKALPQAAPLPVSPVRGQISSLPLQDGVLAPAIPVAGAGYVLPSHGGRLLFGATSDLDDLDPSLRAADHAHNLEQATQLGCLSMLDKKALSTDLQGRVAWRAVTPDRLPYVGALPLNLADSAQPIPGQKSPRLDQPRLIPRLCNEHGGVYVITGFGSRGITWAALAGELLASWVTGSPCPVEAALRDALDPARIVTRAKARAQTSG
ncbi:FAD-dependent 5-carboxymethylaminomethyl-2-thiouridine(34) oxidoreductase MnmC [Aquabacterium sp. CECT 9606]|uniref:FAD-dependent 5-carboxymethylaminomethyl-2-thiouridine(34) oxidoreductase MnmC n=1 Tax=Aquabacterium sp. CECT 9606 TaxID=2845822 RepID=UPI001E49702F|nr:FAD-dependent 5-carboxymethylaminomethyl-2-thiouridine(34) oxidoreductase MnmC [Aquabacterium sp. CECT 9606]CAH0352639.1 tRNA 5-methylaminomethyl-2-thiouridine biosynthesis bifunctional protein MnmC [Aquabacterium sp. CECT 9606]